MKLRWAEDIPKLDVLNQVLRDLSKKTAGRYFVLGSEINDCFAAARDRDSFLKRSHELGALLKDIAGCTESKALGKLVATVQSLVEQAQTERDQYLHLRSQLQALDTEWSQGNLSRLKEYQTILAQAEKLSASLFSKLDDLNLEEIYDTGPLNQALRSPLSAKAESLIDALKTIETAAPDTEEWWDPKELESHVKGNSKEARSAFLLGDPIDDCRDGIKERTAFKKALLKAQVQIRPYIACLRSKAVAAIYQHLEKVIQVCDEEVEQLTRALTQLTKIDQDLEQGREPVGYETLYVKLKESQGYLEHVYYQKDVATELKELLGELKSPGLLKFLDKLEALEVPRSPQPEAVWKTPSELQQERKSRMAHHHYREVCSGCGIVGVQCRCNSPAKETRYVLCASCKTAVKTKPSFPNLTDEYRPTDPTLWKLVLQVASGELQEYRRGERVIHAPNDGRGYRNMPHNPKGIAWAVKQYKGFNGNWKGKEARWLEDKIPGGLADKGPPKGVDPKQIEKGIQVEMEHTNDKDIAREIAYDHLTEDPKYYDKLELVEKHARFFQRLAAGGVEITTGPETLRTQNFEALGLVNLSGVQGKRSYWNLTEAGRALVGKLK